MTDFILTPKAKEILDFGGSYSIPDDREDLFGFASDMACSDGFGYGLFDGGYINAKVIIADEKQLNEITEAIKLLRKFKTVWEQIAAEI